MNKQPEVRARTRQKLINAFWALCEEKNMNQIAVGELARKAGYNRSTFYEYFTDIPDLVRQVEDELLEEIKNGLTEAVPHILEMPANQEQQQKAFQAIFQVLSEPVYCLLGPHGDPAFFSRVRETLMPFFSERLHLPVDSVHFDYIASFTYSALIGYMQHWHEQGQNLSEDEFFRLGFQLLSKGVLEVLNTEGDAGSPATAGRKP